MNKNNEINNKKIINNVKLDDNINNKNVNSDSLCNLFIKNNDNIKEMIINNCNSCKKNNFIIQNLRNTIDKEITSPKLIASFKPKLNVNQNYRLHHNQNFNSQIQFLNRTTDKILSSNNRPKVVFKSNGCKSIFLSKNIIYKGF